MTAMFASLVGRVIFYFKSGECSACAMYCRYNDKVHIHEHVHGYKEVQVSLAICSLNILEDLSDL